MVEVPLSVDLARIIDQEWRKSACRADTVLIAGVKVVEVGGSTMVEAEHFHHSEPHQRYWRVIMKDGDIQTSDCTPNPALFR